MSCGLRASCPQLELPPNIVEVVFKEGRLARESCCGRLSFQGRRDWCGREKWKGVNVKKANEARDFRSQGKALTTTISFFVGNS